MKNILVSFVMLFFASALLAQEEPIVLHTPTGEIQGTLQLPEQKVKIPVILLIAGSGPTDRDGNQPVMKNNSLKLLSQSLADAGMAVVRYDKRGIAASAEAGKKEEDLRLDDYVNDVRLWVDLLAKDTRFSKIIVAGHSEGSQIGMIACEDNPKVAAFISIAGPGKPADEILKEQLSTQPQVVKDMSFPIIDSLRKGETVADVNPMLNALFRASVQPYLISWFKYDPMAEIAKLNMPALIVQGTTDIQVSTEHAELLHKANLKSEMLIIQGMNHVLKDCETTDQMSQIVVYQNPDLPLSKELPEGIIRFIKNNIK